MEPQPWEPPKLGFKPADYGWMALTAGVMAWNAFAPETLSSGVDRYLNSKARHLAVGAVVVTASHLVNIIPRGLDPIYHGVDLMRRMTGRQV